MRRIGRHGGKRPHHRQEGKRARRRHRIEQTGRQRRDIVLTEEQRDTKDTITYRLFQQRFDGRSINR